METNIRHLIDFKKVDSLLEGFSKTTGFVTAILDLEGNVLSKSGWRLMCTEFHRQHPETLKKCTISDSELANKMGEGEKYHFYTCLNGLVDVAVPLIINGEHVANLFSGQFFFEEPDSTFFKKQAEKYGFDEGKYLAALKNVPVVSQEKVKTAMDFLLNMTQMISDMTFQKLEQTELNQNLRESEEKANESEKRFRKSIEFSPVPIAVADSNGDLLFLNKQYVDTFGYSLEELGSIPKWFELVYPDIEYRNLVLTTWNDDVEFAIKNSVPTPVRECFVTCKNGVVKTVEISVSIENDISIGLFQDITERKIAEEKIRGKDLQFRKLSANVPDLIFQFTRRPDGTYFVPVSSEGIKNIFGCSPEDVIDDFAPIARVLFPEDSERVIHEFEYSAAHLSHFTCEFRIQIPGKPMQWILSRSTPEKLPDGSITWYGFNADITERKQAEEEIKKQLDELQRWHRVTIGREGRVLKLKQEVNELLKQLDKPIAYPSAEQDKENDLRGRSDLL